MQWLDAQNLESDCLDSQMSDRWLNLSLLQFSPCIIGIMKVLIQALCGGPPLYAQHFGRLRQADHLKPEVQDLPGQHGKTPSLLKI